LLSFLSFYFAFSQRIPGSSYSLAINRTFIPAFAWCSTTQPPPSGIICNETNSKVFAIVGGLKGSLNTRGGLRFADYVAFVADNTPLHAPRMFFTSMMSNRLDNPLNDTTFEASKIAMFHRAWAVFEYLDNDGNPGYQNTTGANKDVITGYYFPAGREFKPFGLSRTTATDPSSGESFTVRSCNSSTQDNVLTMQATSTERPFKLPGTSSQIDSNRIKIDYFVNYFNNPSWTGPTFVQSDVSPFLCFMTSTGPSQLTTPMEGTRSQQAAAWVNSKPGPLCGGSQIAQNFWLAGIQARLNALDAPGAVALANAQVGLLTINGALIAKASITAPDRSLQRGQIPDGVPASTNVTTSTYRGYMNWNQSALATVGGNVRAAKVYVDFSTKYVSGNDTGVDVMIARGWQVSQAVYSFEGLRPSLVSWDPVLGGDQISNSGFSMIPSFGVLALLASLVAILGRM